MASPAQRPPGPSPFWSPEAGRKSAADPEGDKVARAAAASIGALPPMPAAARPLGLETLLEEILTDHPAWRRVINQWEGVSLQDQIWVLQFFELYAFRQVIPQIVQFFPSNDTPFYKHDPHFLLSQKLQIQRVLGEVKWFDFSGRGLQKCPKAIGLLPNLEVLNLSMNQLTTPPDVSQNTKLLSLILSNNALVAAPDVSRLAHLQGLYLGANKITVAPNVTQNTKLDTLGLHSNLFRIPPDLSGNVNLKHLDLSGNPLAYAPDVRRNVSLNALLLGSAQLTNLPDLSQNLGLISLDLRGNKLSPAAVEAFKRLKREREAETTGAQRLNSFLI